MKRYYDLTQEEKLALNGAQIHDSIKLEALHRGIKPPLTLNEFINQHGFQGFTIPADSTVFYEIIGPGSYSTSPGESTGLAFKTEEEARRAINGAIFLAEEGYGAEKRTRVRSGELSYKATYVHLNKPQYFGSKLEQYEQPEDDAKYTELSDEIQAELNNLWQESYNKKVRSQKRAEYLRLANNDEEIAKAFWGKTEREEWPLE